MNSGIKSCCFHSITKMMSIISIHRCENEGLKNVMRENVKDKSEKAEQHLSQPITSSSTISSSSRYSISSSALHSKLSYNHPRAILIHSRRILVLLVFSNQILHVGFSLSELVCVINNRSQTATCLTYLHFVHTLLSIPMQEGLPLEHGSELIADTLEKFLDSGRVAQEGNSHFKPSRRNVTVSSENIVGDPFHKIRWILVLDIEHLLFNVFHGNFATENGSHLKVCQRFIAFKKMFNSLWGSDRALGLTQPSCSWRQTFVEWVQEQ